MIKHTASSVSIHISKQQKAYRLLPIFFLIIALSLNSISSKAQSQQNIGFSPYMDGGFEGQPSSGAAATFLFAPSYYYTVNNSNSAVTFNATGGRSGPKYVTWTVSGSSSNGFYTPSDNATAVQSSTSYVVQFYYKYSSSSSSLSFRVSASPDAANAFGSAVSTSTLNQTTWTKASVVVTSGSGAITNGLIRFTPSSTFSTVYALDDIVIYPGTSVDNAAPDNASAGTLDSTGNNFLTMHWTAPSTGVDGGGYLVMRYTSSPSSPTAPNTNGIYAIGNTIGTGTVAYIGTSTSFTDNGLSPNSSYYYLVYTVDKAFNYSSTPAIVSGTTINNAAFKNLTVTNRTLLATVSDSVGIGTTTPTQKLEVKGNVKIDSSLCIGTANFAANKDTVLYLDATGKIGKTTISSLANPTTSDSIYANAILGVEALRSSATVGTSNVFTDGYIGGQRYVMGYGNNVVGGSEINIFGYGNSVNGFSNTVVGKNNTLVGNSSIIIGRYNASSSSSSFMLGERDSSTSPAYGSFAIGESNKVANQNAYSFGLANNTSGYESVAIGIKNTASNFLSTAFGMWNNVSGARSAVFGYKNNVSGLYTYAFGKENTVATNATRGVAVGCDNTVSAPYAHAFGRDLTNNTPWSIMMGVSGTAYMMLLQSGYVGIGTTTPTQKLEVNGNLKIDSLSSGSSTDSIVTVHNGVLGKIVAGSSALTPLTLQQVTDANHSTTDSMFIGGKVGIGTTIVPDSFQLAVNGAAIFTKAKIKSYSAWPDYVFEDNYGLLPIVDLEKYLKQNKHLPEVPSEATIKKSGIDIGDNETVLLKKIEELTLYIIDQNKKTENENKEIQQQNEQLQQLQKQIDELKKLIQSK